MPRPLILLASGLFACTPLLSESRFSSDVSQTSALEWKGPLPTPPPPAGVDSSLLAQLPPPGTTLTLRKLVTFALQNSPQTRSSWLNARAAAAGVVSRRSAWYPTLAADVQAGYTHSTVGGTTVLDGFTLRPGASLSFLVFDLGGRSADIEEAEALLEVANLSHNRTVQDVVLNVEQAYFQYLSAKALVAANEDTLKETQTAFQAAQERRNAGVATIADVLQAKTLVSQARLALQQNQGQVIALRGALATSLGVPANLPVEVGELPAELPLRPLGEAVEKLITEAQAKRPDLARARAQAIAASTRERSIESRGLPFLSFSAGAARTFLLNDCCAHGDNYNAGITLSIPIFNGFRDSADRRQALEQARAAQADAESLEQQIILQVWTSYQAVKTAELRVGTSKDLLESAQESANVAQGRYKAGVGSILDVLTAEVALANARAQEVQARADWLLSLASLSHDTGALDLLPGQVSQ
ncbi:MAG: TolC family protein [Myxococcales bacterium]